MLGKLFNLTTGAAGGVSPSAHGPSSSSSAKPISSLESVQEDIHTRNLLFPDAQSLYQHRHDQVFPLSSGSPLPSTSTANAFDYDGDIELDSRDVRIVIMQDALSSVPAALLYDSQPPPPLSSPPADRPSTVAGFATTTAAGWQDGRRPAISPRKGSLGGTSRPVVIQPDSPQPRQGAFDRRASIHGRSQPQPPRAESDSQRAYREYAEELGVFSSCIFGNSELMAYKGTSTKVHVVPSDPRNDALSSVIVDGRGSLGRASMRSSKLSQSFSSEAIGDFLPPISAATPTRPSDRKKVLITRLFPVTLPSGDDMGTLPSLTPQSRLSEDSAGFPFPYSGDDSKMKKKKPQPKQKRLPMYAVALIINLPQTSPHLHTAVSTSSRQVFRGAGSYNEQDSFPSSFGSGRRSGWTMVGQGLGHGLGGGIDPMDSSYLADIEDRIDPITQHWDIIMRTLTHLQSIVAMRLCTMLRHADIASPDPMPSSITSQVSRNPSLSRRRSDDGVTAKPAKSNAKLLTLPHNCLMDNAEVKTEVDIAKARIVAGLRATRVITGQNRWGIWREEARWVAKWAGGREQGFFFYNLLTGYLATHTDWLQALSPMYYRKRHLQLMRARGEEDMVLPARTIVVANDKMAARRLVFLLSAFLPANQQLQPSIRAHRPSTSASFGAFSHSPPSYVVPILKEESLRRKINRRTAPRRTSHSRTTSLQGQEQRQGQGSQHGGRGSGVPAYLAHLSMDRAHERRPSDAASIRTANLPISGSDSFTRKSSAATTATVTPEATIPHFSTAQRYEPSHASRRPGSSGSVAADDLKRTLQRGDSGGSGQLSGMAGGGGGPRPSSTWGVLAGLWSARRRGSTDLTSQKRDSFGSRDSRDNLPSSGFNAPPMSPTKVSFRNQELPLGAGRGGRDAATATTKALNQLGGGGLPSHELEREQQRVVSYVSGGLPPTGPESGTHTPRQPDDSQELAAPPRTSALFQRIPDPSGAFESPVKTSINVQDGVIDVDVPFPDYITSFETAVSSPSSSGYLSTPGGGSSGLEAFEYLSRLAADGDLPLNVAGWLQRYHPDFILQAIPPQHDLLGEVKASLRAEPSPAVVTAAVNASLASYSMSPTNPPQPQERWLDVSSAIIADCTTFSITRVRYRRLVRPKPAAPALLLTPGGTGASGPPFPTAAPSGSTGALITPAIPPYEPQLEEEFIIEPIVTLDEVLVEAVERVVGTGVNSSSADAAAGTAIKAGGGGGVGGGDSASPSRSASKRRTTTELEQAGGNVTSSEPLDPHLAEGPGTEGGTSPSLTTGAVAAAPVLAPPPQQEVPRAECKAVILSALEEVVRDVVEMRERESQESGGGANDNSPGHVRERESDLRVAVRAWLESVEIGGE